MSAPSARPHADDALLLMAALAVAVPMHIAQARGWSVQQRAAAARVDRDVIASHGDDLLVRGRHTAAAFNSLARALALLADQPGGVSFTGQHWCTRPHPGCPHRRIGEHRPMPPDAAA